MARKVQATTKAVLLKLDMLNWGLIPFFPFFSSMVLFKNQLFPQGVGGFLERRIPGKNGEVTSRMFIQLNEGRRSQVKHAYTNLRCTARATH